MATPGSRPARRPHRSIAARRRPVTAGVAVVLLGVLGACSSSDAGTPAAGSTTSPTPTRSAPTPSATPTRTTTPTAAPSPSTAPDPAASPSPDAGRDTGAGSGAGSEAGSGAGTGSAPGARSGVQLRSGGRLGDLPMEAPEADAVAYLTGVFGTGPRVEDPESACGYDVGRRIGWADLTVFVRSVDELGAPSDPYVAAWAVQAPSLATVEGLRVGDPEARITELYPGAVSGEDEHTHGSTWWSATTPDGGTYAFVTEGGAVSRLSSGAVCGG